MTKSNGYAGCLIYVRMSAADIRRARQQAHGDAEKMAALINEKIASHTSDCLAYAADEDWDVLAVRSDNMISGSARYRRVSDVLEGRDETLADLRERAGQRLVLLSTEVERLYRDTDESRELVRIARRTPLTVVSTDGEAYDLSTANGEAAFEGAVSKAQREAGKVSERRRRQERRRADAGGYWGNEPFGYHKVYDTDPGTGQRYYTGRLVLCTGSCCPAAGIAAEHWVRTRPASLADVPPCTHHGNGCWLDPARELRLSPAFWQSGPDGLEDDDGPDETSSSGPLGEAELIVMAARAVAAGATLASVTRSWDAIGLTTRNGERWSQQMIRHLLLNKRIHPFEGTAQGIRVHRPGDKWGRASRTSEGTETPGLWPATLDDELAVNVRGVLTDPERYKYLLAGHTRGAKAHLLAGLAECGNTWGPEGGVREGTVCGTKMKGHPAPRSSKSGARQYACPKVHGGCGRCRRNTGMADGYVIEHIRRWTRPGGEYDQFLAAERARYDAERAAATAQLTAIEQEKTELARQRDRVSAAIGTGIALGDMVYGDEQHKILKAKVRELDDQKVECGVREKKLLAAALPPTLDDVRADLEQLWDPDAPVAVRAEIVRRFVAKVIIYPPGQGQRAFDPATIEVIPGPWADGFTQEELALSAGRSVRRPWDAIAAWLGQNPGSTAREAAEALSMPHSTACTLLSAMEGRGDAVVTGKRAAPGKPAEWSLAG